MALSGYDVCDMAQTALLQEVQLELGTTNEVAGLEVCFARWLRCERYVSSWDCLTATLHQQEAHHLSAADAQQRQLHAFNMALLEQAEELAALQALLGAPSRKQQSIKRRVTEDLMDSMGKLQVAYVT